MQHGLYCLSGRMWCSARGECIAISRFLDRTTIKLVCKMEFMRAGWGWRVLFILSLWVIMVQGEKKTKRKEGGKNKKRDQSQWGGTQNERKKMIDVEWTSIRPPLQLWVLEASQSDPWIEALQPCGFLQRPCSGTRITVTTYRASNASMDEP